MNVGSQIAEMQRQENAEIAREDESRRVESATRYAAILCKQDTTADDMRELYVLAKELRRDGQQVEADHAAVQAWHEHYRVVLPSLAEAQREYTKARDAAARARAKTKELETAERLASSKLSSLNCTARRLPKVCGSSSLFRVNGRDIEPLFESQTFELEPKK